MIYANTKMSNNLSPDSSYIRNIYMRRKHINTPTVEGIESKR